MVVITGGVVRTKKPEGKKERINRHMLNKGRARNQLFGEESVLGVRLNAKAKVCPEIVKALKRQGLERDFALGQTNSDCREFIQNAVKEENLYFIAERKGDNIVISCIYKGKTYPEVWKTKDFGCFKKNFVIIV